MQLNPPKELVSFSVHSLSDVSMCLVFIDTDKQETKNTLRVPAFTEREVSNLVFYTQSTQLRAVEKKTKEKEFQIIALCNASAGLLTNNNLDKPANNMGNRTPKTSEIVVL